MDEGESLDSSHAQGAMGMATRTQSRQSIRGKDDRLQESAQIFF